MTKISEDNEDAIKTLELKQQKVEFAENGSPVRCLKFSDCGRFLAVSKSDTSIPGNLSIWSVNAL